MKSMLQSTFAVEKMPTSNLNLSRNNFIQEQRLLELMTQKKKSKIEFWIRTENLAIA